MTATPVEIYPSGHDKSCHVEPAHSESVILAPETPCGKPAPLLVFAVGDLLQPFFDMNRPPCSAEAVRVSTKRRCANMSSVSILVVDDYEPWRRYVSSSLQRQPELEIVCEATDGLEAVEQTEKLKPDLILLDIGLPKLNGIEVARRVRRLAPQSKILIVSQDSFADVAKEAFSLGAWGYVDKADAGSELLPAVNAVLRGKKFVGSRFAGHDFTDTTDAQKSLRPTMNAD